MRGSELDHGATEEAGMVDTFFVCNIWLAGCVYVLLCGWGVDGSRIHYYKKVYWKRRCDDAPGNVP